MSDTLPQMPPETLRAEMVRLPRRLLPLLVGLEVPLTLAELATVIVPIVLFFPASRHHSELLSGPALLLLIWSAVAAWWLRPLARGVRPLQFQTAYRQMRSLARRLLAVRVAGWIALAALAVIRLGPDLRLGGLQLGALASICVGHSFAVVLLRWAVQERLFRSALSEMGIEPSWLQVQADTLRDRLSEISFVMGAITAAFLVPFVLLFVPISVDQFLRLEITFPWTAILLGLVWYYVTRPPQIRPILDYLRAPVADGETQQAKLLRACQTAHRLPPKMAILKLSFFCAFGALLSLEALTLLRYTLQQAALILAAIVIVTTGTCIYEMIWARSMLRPLVAHLMAQPGAPDAEVRAPSLRRKLLLSFGGVLVFTVVLPLFWAYLQQGGLHHGFASAIFFFAAVLSLALGVIWLTSSDLTRPLAALEQRATEMAQGKLDQRVLPGGEFDEVGRLTAAFESMRRALLAKIRTIEQLNLGLEEKVGERTAELSRSNAELTATIAALTEAQHRLVLSEKMASVGKLVAGIAHEIGNPLNAVVNTVEPLAETVREMGSSGGAAESREDLEAMLRVIRSAAQRTQRIVQALRNYTRQDGEALSRMNLHADIEESLALLQHPLRGLELQRELRATSGEIVAYRGQLNQAIVNLLSNSAGALEGRSDGMVTVRTADEGELVRIDVEDNGPGIPDAVLPRIFDPFFTTKEVGRGTGLGLSITHDIVERHGGRIDVRTSAAGTCFSIRIPRSGPALSAERPERRSGAADQGVAGG
jgi:signal transduction histidine kinase